MPDIFICFLYSVFLASRSLPICGFFFLPSSFAPVTSLSRTCTFGAAAHARIFMLRMMLLLTFFFLSLFTLLCDAFSLPPPPPIVLYFYSVCASALALALLYSIKKNVCLFCFFSLILFNVIVPDNMYVHFTLSFSMLPCPFQWSPSWPLFFFSLRAPLDFYLACLFYSSLPGFVSLFFLNTSIDSTSLKITALCARLSSKLTHSCFFFDRF